MKKLIEFIIIIGMITGIIPALIGGLFLKLFGI